MEGIGTAYRQALRRSAELVASWMLHSRPATRTAAPNPNWCSPGHKPLSGLQPLIMDP